MESNNTCKVCNKPIDGVEYQAHHYITKQEYYFDTIECLHSWAKQRLVVLGIILVLCLVVLIGPLISGEYILSWAFMLPYMIRIAYFKLRGLFSGDGGWFSEFIGFFIVLIATFTIVYPLVKFVKEVLYYVSILKNKSTI